VTGPGCLGTRFVNESTRRVATLDAPMIPKWDISAFESAYYSPLPQVEALPLAPPLLPVASSYGSPALTSGTLINPATAALLGMPIEGVQGALEGTPLATPLGPQNHSSAASQFGTASLAVAPGVTASNGLSISGSVLDPDAPEWQSYFAKPHDRFHEARALVASHASPLQGYISAPGRRMVGPGSSRLTPVSQSYLDARTDPEGPARAAVARATAASDRNKRMLATAQALFDRGIRTAGNEFLSSTAPRQAHAVHAGAQASAAAAQSAALVPRDPWMAQAAANAPAKPPPPSGFAFDGCSCCLQGATNFAPAGFYAWQQAILRSNAGQADLGDMMCPHRAPKSQQ
jgi:hypothetical protein